METKELTLNDIVFQMENFEFSKEHYDMLVEESEINVMESFLATTEYAAENADLGVLMESGFFMEAGEENKALVQVKLNDKKQSYGAKVRNIINRIISFLKNIGTSIVNAFAAIAKKLSPVLDKFSTKLTEEQAAEIKSAVETCARNANFPISKAYIDDLESNILRRMLTKNDEKIRNKLIARLTEGPINVTPSQDNYANAISLEQFSKIFSIIAKLNLRYAPKDKKIYGNAIKKLSDAMDYQVSVGRHQGLTLKLKDADELTNGEVREVEKLLASVKKDFSSAENDKNAKTDQREYLALTVGATTKLLKITADSAKLYAAYTKYASTLATKLPAILVKKAEAEKNTEE